MLHYKKMISALSKVGIFNYELILKWKVNSKMTVKYQPCALSLLIESFFIGIILPLLVCRFEVIYLLLVKTRVSLGQSLTILDSLWVCVDSCVFYKFSCTVSLNVKDVYSGSSGIWLMKYC